LWFKSKLNSGQLVISPTGPCFEYVQYNARCFTFHSEFRTVCSLFVSVGLPCSGEHCSIIQMAHVCSADAGMPPLEAS
jgi:hypothetical protein